MAFEPDANLFELPDVDAYARLRALSQDTSILIDDSTQADYGPLVDRRFSMADMDREAEIGGRRFLVQGVFKLGTGLAANGAVITSHFGFGRITPWDIHSTASIGLVQVNGNEQQKQRVLERLRERTALITRPYQSAEEASAQSPATLAAWFGGRSELTESGAVSVLSREEAMELEETRWLWQTPIGLIFQLGVMLSLLVGGAIVYMILSTDVANRLPEYATLLAIGYSRRYLASIVMTQAIVLSVLGFGVAWALAEILYRLTFAFSNIPLVMNPTRVLLVSLLGLLMCCFSGLLALRKLWKAEPASLF